MEETGLPESPRFGGDLAQTGDPKETAARADSEASRTPNSELSERPGQMEEGDGVHREKEQEEVGGEDQGKKNGMPEVVISGTLTARRRAPPRDERVLSFSNFSVSSDAEELSFFSPRSQPPPPFVPEFWDAPGIYSEPRCERVRANQPGKSRARFGLGSGARPGLGFSSHLFHAGFVSGETRRDRLEKRPLNRTPFRILDAPAVLNDYYLNLLDWSATDIVALALSDQLYLWNAKSKEVSHLASASPGNYISAVSFSPEGVLGVGASDGSLRVFDPEKSGEVVISPGASGNSNGVARISSLSWASPYMVSAGYKNGNILNFDTRAPAPYASGGFVGHRQEICGLKWERDGTLLASGSNDNTVCIWRQGSVRPRQVLAGHKAAVRALAWCPWKKGVLATGGGTNDRSIKTWDTNSAVELSSVETGSQVCGLVFSEKYRELISTHGYSDNSICIWKFCSMRKIGDLEGHTDRVLYSALSPSGNVLATCAPDENLNFWLLFDGHVDTQGEEGPGSTRVR